MTFPLAVVPVVLLHSPPPTPLQQDLGELTERQFISELRDVMPSASTEDEVRAQVSSTKQNTSPRIPTRRVADLSLSHAPPACNGRVFLIQ
jgi:hypothetical protein